MSLPVIHQLLIGASEGDAITQMALEVRNELQKHAISEIFAIWRHGPLMEDEIRDFKDMPDSESVDITLYHSSIGRQEMSNFLRTRSEKLALSYHNITPSHLYVTHNPDFAADLDLGRQDLAALRERVVLAMADSEFNALDLNQAGYSDVHVVPAGFSPSRLSSEEYDFPLMQEMARRFPNGYVVAVGQILPHKRVEQLLQTMHIMNSTYWGNIGLVVCGVARQELYRASVSRYHRRCAMVDVHFAGQVSNRQLSTLMRGARVYLGMSDHEGLSIPPIEAMSMGVPVVVKGAAAIPETVGDGALVLPSDAGPTLAAEAVHEVLTNNQLRWSMIYKGLRRSNELESGASSTTTVKLLLAAVP